MSNTVGNPYLRHEETEQQVKTRENNFNYHAPTSEQVEVYKILRDAGNTYSQMLNQLCPQSRELSLAQTHLEQVVFWANASIARN